MSAAKKDPETASHRKGPPSTPAPETGPGKAAAPAAKTPPPKTGKLPPKGPPKGDKPEAKGSDPKGPPKAAEPPRSAVHAKPPAPASAVHAKPPAPDGKGQAKPASDTKVHPRPDRGTGKIKADDTGKVARGDTSKLPKADAGKPKDDTGKLPKDDAGKPPTGKLAKPAEVAAAEGGEAAPKTDTKGAARLGTTKLPPPQLPVPDKQEKEKAPTAKFAMPAPLGPSDPTPPDGIPGVAPGAPPAEPAAPAPAPAPVPGSGGEDDFDALGFDTSFGAGFGGGGFDVNVPLTPLTGGFGASPGGMSDKDDTPPGGIMAGEEMQVLNAQTIGKALAEADGTTEDHALPDLSKLQAGLIGIDIGASAAVVARFNDDGQHEIVPNQDSERATPATMLFDEDGEQIVGREARNMAASQPARAVIDLKEMIADPFFRLKTGQDELEAKTILGLLLKRLIDDVERHADRPTHVALAAPAWFGEPQREVLHQAVQAAGVTLVGITDEALAAAVPYSLRLPDLRPRTAVVVDLGHAALGVGIVRCAGGDITVLAQDAKRDLGSARWDLLLAQEAARKFKQAHGFDPMDDKGAALDLKLRAEDAKRDLSRRNQCTLMVSARDKSLKVGFTRPGFEDAAKGLIEKSLAFARQVRDKAGLDAWSKLDALIVTGGGSRTPAFRAAITQEIGREPEKGVAVEEGVAIGALYWGIGERHRKSKA